MIPRHVLQTVREALDRQAAVAIIGPRQVGKTTLALALAEETEKTMGSDSIDWRLRSQAVQLSGIQL